MSRRVADFFPHAFVTGASAGLGRAFTEMLLADGVRVWGTARDGGRLADLASRHPTLFTPVVLDLADAPAAETAFLRAAKAAGGAFDLVLNNAGYGIFMEFETADFAAWQAQLERMIIATLRLSHAALRGMRARDRGCLVNVSSLAAEFPLPFMSGYNVAKAALSAFSESLIVETRGSGISVIDFRPGDFRTDFNQAMQTATAATTQSASAARAWRALEANRESSPEPRRAAADLRRALCRRRRGLVRTGPFFQAVIAPFCCRFLPASARLFWVAKYFRL